MADEKTICRFWSKVDIKTKSECWNWLAGKFSSGYGSFWYLNRDVRASRFAYEITFGQINDATMLVCHSCDNRACCNPNHLWLGSVQANIADMDMKGRRAPRHGEFCGSHKLKQTQVAEIRSLYTSGKFNQYELANMFDVSQPHISKTISKLRRSTS